ncbi:protein of unknown function [Cyanobium sp. NIES-981]|nr:protein of unknown function [Cyanobium sp. NIES-981]
MRVSGSAFRRAAPSGGPCPPATARPCGSVAASPGAARPVLEMPWAGGCPRAGRPRGPADRCSRGGADRSLECLRPSGVPPGEVAEWSKANDSKSFEGQPSVGSNPTLSVSELKTVIPGVPVTSH